MMLELAMLDLFQVRLNGLGLIPAPKIGVIEPASTDDLPAIVLSIEESIRSGNGLGERSTVIRNRALAVASRINLADPSLPGVPGFSLLSANRRQLSLPHGGLVRADGSLGPLTGADVKVARDAAPFTLVAASPGAGEFTVDALSGLLLFGQALPQTGMIEASYFVGQWEQRILRASGVLRMVVTAPEPAAVAALTKQALDGLARDRGASSAGLSGFSLAEMGSVAAIQLPLAAWRQAARLRFQFELEVNEPESSGGIIQRIPIQTNVG